MDAAIQKIIEAGTLAPSGENCQPWRFRVRGREVDVFNVPERDYSLYSWGQRASLVAHGAVLENMAITAGFWGYQAEIIFFPNPSNENWVATVLLRPGENQKDPLFEAVALRTTNRKIYKQEVLLPEQKNKIMATGQVEGQGRVVLVEDRKKVEQFAKLASANERILFENRFLHSFFFKHISWTNEQDERVKTGFYIDTLELPPPAKAGFKLFKNWFILNAFNKLGLSKMVAKENAKIYSSASAIGSIVIKNNSAEEFLGAGRLMQRVWLTVTEQGLSLQPLTGIIFLMQRILGGEVKELSSPHVELIKKTYLEMKAVLGAREETLAMCFRIGKSDAPSARAKRLPPEIVWE